MSTWTDIDERDDHYLGLAGANVVATEALLVLPDNLADVVAAKAMMCVHGDAGLGKTLSSADPIAVAIASLIALRTPGRLSVIVMTPSVMSERTAVMACTWPVGA